MQPEYSTCVHLKRDAVRGACKVVTGFSAGSLCGPDEGQWLACTRCDWRGSRLDATFMDHFVSQKHHVAVRLQEPREIYCVICGDYQYHSDFDRRLGLGRYSRWGRAALPPVPRMTPPLSAELGSPGFVNMGNTCFLSSVLQVLLHNCVLQKYYNKEPARHVGGNNSPATIPEAACKGRSACSVDKYSCIACEVESVFKNKSDR